MMKAEDVQSELIRHPLPDIHGDLVSVEFVPLYRSPKGWRFWCKALGKDGRCTIYHRRPRLCQSYQAGMEYGCWHFDETTAHLRRRRKEKGTLVDLLATVEKIDGRCPKVTDDGTRTESVDSGVSGWGSRDGDRFAIKPARARGGG
jgi:Fe-S-cluster containining protein